MSATYRNNDRTQARQAAAPAGQPGAEEGSDSGPIPGQDAAGYRSRLLNRVGATAVLTAAAITGVSLAPGLGSQAEAATLSAKALSIVATKKGAPYSYGAAGPSRFDCSGLIMWSFKKAGRTLPRTAQAQYNKTHHISASKRKVGDLVFFHSGRSVYHVGIYAGHNKIWHAPRSGTRVRLEKIWTKSVWYGRVG